MSLDNNGQPLPPGYGQSFDYIRTGDDEELVCVYAVDNESNWYPPFKCITRTPLGAEIAEWVDETSKGFGTSETHVIRVKGSEAGIGGTYFCTQANKARVAVFKPYDEEYGAPYNPPPSDSSTGPTEGTRYNLPSGSSTGPAKWTPYKLPSTLPQGGKVAAREIAAFRLDHPTKSKRREGFVGPILGFCRVPVTVPVSCIHGAFNYGNTLRKHKYVWYKFGSLQMFKQNSGSCLYMDDDKLLKDSVQKLCLLDIRYANTDRHLGNLLKVENNGQYELIPIDHGGCFPDNFKWCDFGWLKWNKSREKFSREIVEYIEKLDSKQDIEQLIKEKFTMSYTFARTLTITTMLLKEAVKNRLTPFEIGHFMCGILPNECDKDYSRVRRAVLKIVGEEDLGEISALHKTVSESIEDLIVANLGEPFRKDEVVVKLVEKDSKLRGSDMTKQRVEDELLEIVHEKLKSNLKKYADALLV